MERVLPIGETALASAAVQQSEIAAIRERTDELLERGLAWARKAVDHAGQTDATVHGLADAAGRIGEVNRTADETGAEVDRFPAGIRVG